MPMGDECCQVRFSRSARLASVTCSVAGSLGSDAVHENAHSATGPGLRERRNALRALTISIHRYPIKVDFKSHVIAWTVRPDT
jgi:hypothetical protein